MSIWRNITIAEGLRPLLRPVNQNKETKIRCNSIEKVAKWCVHNGGHLLILEKWQQTKLYFFSPGYNSLLLLQHILSMVRYIQTFYNAISVKKKTNICIHENAFYCVVLTFLEAKINLRDYSELYYYNWWRKMPFEIITYTINFSSTGGVLALKKYYYRSFFCWINDAHWMSVLPNFNATFQDFDIFSAKWWRLYSQF